MVLLAHFKHHSSTIKAHKKHLFDVIYVLFYQLVMT